MSDFPSRIAPARPVRFVLLFLAALTIFGLRPHIVRAQAPAPAFHSDDFDDPALDAELWQLVDPVGDGGAEVVVGEAGEGHLVLTAPAGHDHNASKHGDRTVRLVQDARDEDFEIQAKFDTLPTARFQFQGVQVEAGSGHWLQFQAYHDGRALRLSVVIGGKGAVSRRFRKPISRPKDGVIYLRVQRKGHRWIYSYSEDGQRWRRVGVLDRRVQVEAVGVFVGNARTSATSSRPAPEFTARVDYFRHPAPAATGEETGLAQSSSPADPAIDFWYGERQEVGRLGIPQPWFNISGNLLPRKKRALTYSLNGGPPVKLRVGPDGRRLVRAGDFNAEIPISALRPGVNTVTFRTKDGKGRATSATVELWFWPNQVWPLPYTVDWADIHTPEGIQRVAQVVDGRWRVGDGQLHIIGPGYDRLVAIGDQQWRDYQVETTITIHDYGSRYGVGVLQRWNGHTDDPVVSRNPRSGWLPLGAIGWFSNGRLSIFGNRWRVDAAKTRYPRKGATYAFKMQVQTGEDGRPIYRLKVWRENQPEPKRWSVVARGRGSDPRQGSLLLIAHRTKASFGPVTITPLN